MKRVSSAVMALLCLAACEDGCRRSSAPATPPPPSEKVLGVHRILGPLDINGEPYEQTWELAARTEQLPVRGGKWGA